MLCERKSSAIMPMPLATARGVHHVLDVLDVLDVLRRGGHLAAKSTQRP
jgi:hypothetical protein